MNENKPFHDQFKSAQKLKLVYFKIEVLDKYFKDPRYLVFYSDYRGTIDLKSEYSDQDDEYESIRDFGLAYLKADQNIRAVATFIGDMKELPEKVQSYWFSHLIANQDDYIVNEGFYKNLILGEWVENISIYQALLMEIHYINLMCEAMGLEKLYREEFSFDSIEKDARPTNYHIVLLPTRDNFYNFINTLEKLVVNNINYKTFVEAKPFINSIEPKDEKGNMKGALNMFGEWLRNTTHGQDTDADIIQPLKQLRKLRQKPAHELYQNEYNENIWSDQKDLMHETYKAVRNIRLLFANHPATKGIKIPEVLFDGKHIASY